MSGKTVSRENHPKLSEEVRSMITLKLRFLLKQQIIRLTELRPAACLKLREELVNGLNAGTLEGTLNKVVEALYVEIVAKVKDITKEWPGLVWREIETTLEKVKVGPVNGQELETIVDNYTWRVDKHPSTLGFIDPDKYEKKVRQLVHSYGQKEGTSFGIGFNIAARSGQSDIIFIAKQERERISIAIAEFVLAHKQSIPTPGLKPANTRCKGIKPETQARYERWQKAYLVLFKKHKHNNMSDVWYSQQIKKMDISDGRAANTIKKNMRKNMEK